MPSIFGDYSILRNLMFLLQLVGDAFLCFPHYCTVARHFVFSGIAANGGVEGESSVSVCELQGSSSSLLADKQFCLSSYYLHSLYIKHNMICDL